MGQERVVLYGGSPSVRLAGGDELLDPHQSVAGGPPLRGAEVRAPRAHQPAGRSLWKRASLAVAQGSGHLAHLPCPGTLRVRVIAGTHDPDGVSALGGVCGNLVGDREPLGPVQR